MIDKNSVEKFLRINGVPPDAPDDEIKSILISAQWHEEDVEAAILVLRKNPQNHEAHVDSLHKVFRSDERLRPETISSLLGITMDVTSHDIELEKKRARSGLVPIAILQMFIVALIFSSIFIFTAMWYLHMGPFHETLSSL